jgi:hypothetical protein
VGEVCIGVKLSEKFGPAQFTQRSHKRLVTVITRPKIAPLKSVCGSYLRKLFTVAEDAKFSSSAHHVFATQQAGLSALTGYSVIGQDNIPG